jgi:hypothetical protein
MATINGSTNKSVWTFKLVTTEGTPDIPNNTSPLTVDVYIGRSSSSGSSYMWGASISCGIEVTGCAKQTLTYSNANQVNVAAGGWLHIGGKTFTVPHNTDGSKTVTVSASFTNNVSPSSGSASGSVTLTNIARATTPTASSSSVTMGNTINITISPADSSFKHKIRYEFGTAKSQINGIKVGGTQITADFIPSGAITFTPPTSLGGQIPDTNSGICRFELYTYKSDGTHIGTKTVDLTLNIPSYNLTASVAITGNNLLNGEYVQGKSTLTATITAPTTNLYGATIKRYSSTIDNVTYSGANFTTSVFNTIGSKLVSTIVTDTRGKQVAVTTPYIVVREYFSPHITSFTITRQTDGTTVIATVKGSVSPINNKNGKEITVVLDGVEDGTKKITPDSYTFEVSTTFTGVNTDKSFTATAKIADYYTSASTSAVLPTVSVPLDFLYNNKGVAIGKVSESPNLLDVAWDIKSHGEFRSLEYSKLVGFKYLGVVDLNTIKTAGMYGVYNATNAPINNISTLEVVTYSPDWIVQRLTSVVSGSVYLRRWHSGNTWSVWEKQEISFVLLNSSLTGNATTQLSQTIANFGFIEVFYHDNDNLYGSVRIRNNYSATIKASIGHPTVGNYGYLKTLLLNINGTTATISENKQIAIATSFGTTAASNGVVTTGNFVTIDCIVGIK